MRDECEELLAEAGWIRDGQEFRGGDGERARFVAAGDGLPDHLHLRLASHPIGFALRVYSYDLAASVALADTCHAAIAAGAALPWLLRARRLNPLWIIDADGVRHRVATTVTSARKLAAADAVAVLVDSLINPPAAEAVERAEAAIRALGPDWTDVSGSRAKADPGFVTLRRARFRGPAGEQQLSYVLTGDPSLPEALRWHGRLVDGSTWQYLIGVTDRDAVPSGVETSVSDDRDRLDRVVAVLDRAIACLTSSQAHNAAHALAAVTAVNHDSSLSAPVGFGTSTLPRRPAPSLRRAATALRATPDSKDAWLDLGFAALAADRHHLAIRAFGEATDRGAGEGLPWLWLGWLRRHLDAAAALADLDRAAEAGGVTGHSRLRQAMILGELLAEPQRELAVREQGTVEDPTFAEGWEDYGLALAKRGRAAEAVAVLTEASKHHDTPTLWYHLGYACLLTGDPRAALSHLERAVRLDETFVPRILGDPDLAPLRDEPRFTGLRTLAKHARQQRAEERRQAHVTHRRSLRPDGPPSDPAAGLATLRAAYATCDVHGSRIDDERLPAEMSEPTLRELLTSHRLGLPYRVADFTRRLGYRPEPYEEDPANPLPPGLGAGMFHLGDLGDGDDEVAVDGATGEVFLVELTDGVSYLAPSLTAFLLDRCVPDGDRVWNLSDGDVSHLDDVDGVGEGRLRIYGNRLDAATVERLTEFLGKHGALLDTLLLTGTEGPSAGLGPIDFVAACPNLRRLQLHRGEFDDSVLRHPRLERLSVRQANYSGGVREFGLTADTPLRTLHFEDCVFDADTLYAGPDSVLESFGNSIDEDYGGTFPSRLEFHGTARLRDIRVNCGGASWRLVLRGELPALAEVRQDAQPYGQFDYEVADAAPADRKRYFSLIRKGKNFTNRW